MHIRLLRFDCLHKQVMQGGGDTQRTTKRLERVSIVKGQYHFVANKMNNACNVASGGTNSKCKKKKKGDVEDDVIVSVTYAAFDVIVG